MADLQILSLKFCKDLGDIFFAICVFCEEPKRRVELIRTDKYFKK